VKREGREHVERGDWEADDEMKRALMLFCGFIFGVEDCSSFRCDVLMEKR
jgi:hypothetical protein